MNPPETVKVIGQPFSLEFPKIDRINLATDGHDQGAMNLRELRILVRADQHPRQLRDTAFHEVIHACLHVQEPPAEDEAFVARMAPVLLDVLRSNPEFLAWLLE